MKFVVDENLSRELVEGLRQQGHQVSFVPDIQPGLKNGAVLAYATQQQALLITADKTDFGELIFGAAPALSWPFSCSAPGQNASTAEGCHHLKGNRNIWRAITGESSCYF